MKKLLVTKALVLCLLVNGAYLYSQDNTAFLDLENRIQLGETLADPLLDELEKTTKGQATLQHIVFDESNLEANFDAVRSFIDQKNQEIAYLQNQQTVSEFEIARLAAELANTKTMLDKASQRHLVQYGKKNNTEALIKRELQKTIIALRNLQEKFLKRASSVASNIGNTAKQSMRNVRKSNASKAVVKASAQTKEYAMNAGQAVSTAAQQAVDYVQNQFAANNAAMINGEEQAIAFNNISNKMVNTLTPADQTLQEYVMMDDSMIPDDGPTDVVTQSYKMKQMTPMNNLAPLM